MTKSSFFKKRIAKAAPSKMANRTITAVWYVHIRDSIGSYGSPFLRIFLYMKLLANNAEKGTIR